LRSPAPDARARFSGVHDNPVINVQQRRAMLSVSGWRLRKYRAADM